MSLKPLSDSKKKMSRKATLAVLAKETDRNLIDQIQRLLAKPMHERTHFLRKEDGLYGFRPVARLPTSRARGTSLSDMAWPHPA